MRYAFKAADFGASILFMAMCAKAFWRHFYNDIEQQLQRQNFLSLRTRHRWCQPR
jgi:hypothetical protein